MTDDGATSSARELAYYRRECNDLGARLLRLQEEQSQAFREARRSRTVVKLLREAYRLGDLARSTPDLAGPMLELLVDNTLCDRALLLREEPIGSSTFLVAQAIGMSNVALSTPFSIAAPPSFLYTTGQANPHQSSRDVIAAVGVPFVLWSYDRGSGHALAMGNRSESNVNRPFEPGDQELIEAALSVYLDVLYRKQAEAQLRQAKQAAEAASRSRATGLMALAGEVREPLDAIIDLAETLRARSHHVDRHDSADGVVPALAELPGRDIVGINTVGINTGHMAARDPADEIVKLSKYLMLLVEGAAEQPDAVRHPVLLDVEWVPVDDVVRTALGSAYSTSVKLGIEIESSLPRRRTAVLADRMRIQHVIQHLLASVMRGTSTGGAVRLATSRRSDGGLEMLIGSRGAGPRTVAYPPIHDQNNAADPQDGPNLSFARAIVEAHGGSLVLEASPFGGLMARLLLPSDNTRDFELADAVT